MRLNILSDSEWESGIGQVVVWLSKTEYFREFQERNYGSGLVAVAVNLICQNPIFLFERRIRYSKKEKKIYLDIMLNLSDFVNVSFDERRRIVLNALLKEVPEVIGKYSIESFDVKTFLADFNNKFEPLVKQSPA
ncbi:MAG: hypothetical protein V4484_20845 [Pseudomonadota bacterium]